MAKTRQAFYKSIPELPKAMQTKKRKPKLMAVVDEDNLHRLSGVRPVLPGRLHRGGGFGRIRQPADSAGADPLQRVHRLPDLRPGVHPAHLGRDPHAAHGAVRSPVRHHHRRLTPATGPPPGRAS